jgi:hypothetical protein
MSQFSQKYYKHFIVEDNNIVEVSFWKRVGILQSIIGFLLFLLFALLLLVCITCHCSLHNSNDNCITQLPVSTITYKPKKTNLTEEKKVEITLEEKIPKKVLPKLSELIPKREVTLEDYMYFVNDTKSNYPKYIDPATNRMIKEYRPICSRLDCPVSEISAENKVAYIDWLNTMSNKTYKLNDTDKGFKVVAQ